MIRAVPLGRSSFSNYLLWYLGWMLVVTCTAATVGGVLWHAGYQLLPLAWPVGLLRAVQWAVEFNDYNPTRFFDLAGRNPFNVVNILLAVIVAIRCRVKLWMSVPAWLIGFFTVCLLGYLYGLNDRLLVRTLYDFANMYVALALVKIERFQNIECLMLGAALLLNRWLVSRRAKAKAAATAVVFD